MPRMMVTREVSSGHSTSPTVVPASADSSGRVSSTRFASPWLKRSRRTRSPTLTASSTRADIRRGVETATSTPQDSLNSHSFFGLFTRATTRGTPYSVFASRETTRLTLSSPVAAITTLQRWSAASSREVISQASASSHSACGTRSTEMAVGALSTRRTSWPFSSSSPAIERPTAPAPAMATLISDRPPLRDPWRRTPRPCRPRRCASSRAPGHPPAAPSARWAGSPRRGGSGTPPGRPSPPASC